MERVKVLYEDNHLIAVYKPAGVLVQGDKTGDKCLMDEVKEYLKAKYNKPGNVFLGLLHRLDRPVSGVILFAKTSKGASRLSEQIRNHTITKIYHALVEGKPLKTKATLVHFIEKDANKNKVAIFSKSAPGTLRAELNYEVIKSNKEQSLIKIILGTGRPHQIRAQMAAIGCPIVGDAKYSARHSPQGEGGQGGLENGLQKGEIALCATSLTFQTATGDEIKTVSVPTPFTI